MLCCDTETLWHSDTLQRERCKVPLAVLPQPMLRRAVCCVSPALLLCMSVLCSIKRNGLPDLTFYSDYGSVQKKSAPAGGSSKAAKQ